MINRNRNPRNKQKLSLLLTVVLIITSFSTDFLWVQAESAGEPPVIAVGEQVVSEVVSQLDGEAAVGGDDAVGENVTMQTEQIDIKLVSISHGQEANWTAAETSENPIDLSGMDPDDKIKLTVSFNLLKGWGETDITERTIKEGDFFEISLPDCFVIGTDRTDVPIKAGEVTYATYTLTAGTRKICVKFTDTVYKDNGLYDIWGAVDFVFTLDQSTLNQDTETSIALTTGDNTYNIKLPKKGEEPTVQGIEKKIVSYNESTREITWEIAVGTDSKSEGLPLSGVYVEDTLPVDYLDTSVLSYSVSGGTVTDFSLRDGSKFCYTFPADGTVYYAPTIICVNAKLTSDIFTGRLSGDLGNGELSDVTVTNQVRVSTSEEGELIGTATVDKVIKRRMLSKLGAQTSATRNQWTITVNEDENPIYKATVTDPLDSNIKLVADSVKINSVSYTIGEEKNGILVTYDNTNDANTAQVCQLTIAFKQPFHDKKVIRFETEIKTAGILTGASTIQNAASIQWDIPNGSGSLSSPNWSIPGINTAYNSIMVDKSVTFDKIQGELLWTIRPTTRFTNHTTVYFGDTIPEGQTYVSNSLNVKINNIEVDSSLNAEFDGKTHTTIELTNDRVATGEQINQTVITYRTKALAYGDNQKHSYSNKVTFYADGSSVSDTATIEVANNVLQKAAKTVWKADAVSRNQMEYTITVNQQGMDLSNADSDLIVTDDVSNLFTRNGIAVSDYSIDLNSFSVTGSATAQTIQLIAGDGEPAENEAVYDGSVIKVNLGKSAGTSTYVMKFNAVIHNNVFENDFEDGVKLITANTASISGGNIVGTVTAAAKSDATNQIGNKLVQKTASNYHDGLVDWTVIIDERESEIPRPLTITDTLPAGVNAEFDMDSIQLFKGVHNTDGVVNSIGEQVTEGVTITISSNADGSSSLRVHIASEERTSYVLKYATIITGSLGTLNNHVSLEADGTEKSSSDASSSVNENNTGGSSTRASLVIEKVDAYDDARKIAGTTFGLYRNENDTIPSKTGVTDENGVLTFGALKTNTDYWIQEIMPATGYVLPDPNGKQLYTTGASGSKSTIVIRNKRKTASAQLKKVNEENEVLTGAKFKLYYQKDATTVQGVKLTGNAFDSYVAEGNATEIMVGADGLLLASELPMGSYYFVETQSPNGYSTPDTHFTFEIVNDDSADAKVVYGSEFHVRDEAPTIGEVVNKKSILRLRKVDREDLAQGIRGAKFRIEVQNGSEWTTQVTEFAMASDELGIGNLPYGKTYRIIETAAPTGYLTPSGNAAVVAQFRLDGDGTVVEISGSYTERDSTFTVPNDAAYADVQLVKRDSLGDVLAGVTFDFYQKAGESPDTSVDRLIESGLKTDAMGVLTRTHIKGGSYYFVETATVSACILDVEPIEFTVNQSTNETVIALEKVNSLTEVKFDKKNRKGNLLDGAQMQLTDVSGNVVAEFTTRGMTEIITGVCVCGETYTLTEIKAPKGYKKAKPITFTMDAQGRVVVDGLVQDGNLITMVDAKQPAVDDSGETPTEETQSVTRTSGTSSGSGTSSSTDVRAQQLDLLGPVFGPQKNMFYSQYAAWILGQAGAPNTGDDSMWMRYLLIMLGAILAAGFAVYFIRKDSKKQS